MLWWGVRNADVSKLSARLVRELEILEEEFDRAQRMKGTPDGGNA